MRFYSVHVNGKRSALVKDGFSWPAFFLGPLWLAWKGLWWPLAGWLAWFLLARYGLPAAAQTPVGLAVMLLLGLEGNNLLRWQLAREGWREVGVIAAADEMTARFKWQQAQGT